MFGTGTFRGNTVGAGFGGRLGTTTLAAPTTTGFGGGFARPTGFAGTTIAAPTTIARPVTMPTTTAIAPRPVTTAVAPTTTAIAPQPVTYAAPVTTAAPIVSAPVMSAPTQPYREQLPTGVVEIAAEKEFEVPDPKDKDKKKKIKIQTDARVYWAVEDKDGKWTPVANDKDVTANDVGTVLGFPTGEDGAGRVRVKFSKDFWDIKAEELQVVTFQAQYAPQQYIYTEPQVEYLVQEPMVQEYMVAPTTYVEGPGGVLYEYEGGAPTVMMETGVSGDYLVADTYVADTYVTPTYYGEPVIVA